MGHSFGRISVLCPGQVRSASATPRSSAAAAGTPKCRGLLQSKQLGDLVVRTSRTGGAGGGYMITSPFLRF